MARIDRTTLAVATIVAIPPGVGIWLATLRVTGEHRPLLAAFAGVLGSVLLFLAILGLAGYGRVEPLD